MISLNLLSPKQKETLKVRVLTALIERSLISLFAVALSLAVILLLIRIELTQELTRIQSQETLSSQYAAVNNKIRTINGAVARLDRVQQGFVPISRLYADIIGRMPIGVTLDGIKVDMGTKIADIQGNAALREDLIAFEAALKDSPFVAGVESPIANLFSRKELSFRLTLTIKPEAIRALLDENP
jgi:hypothetical protein